jgi:hypothetical protein
MPVSLDRGNGVPGHPIRSVHLTPERWFESCNGVRQAEKQQVAAKRGVDSQIVVFDLDIEEFSPKLCGYPTQEG